MPLAFAYSSIPLSRAKGFPTPLVDARGSSCVPAKILFMQQLVRLLQEKLIPRAKAGAAERIVVARKRMSAADVPPGVELDYRKMSGERVIVKGNRLYGNTRLISAFWPEAGMHEAEVPRLIAVVEGQIDYPAGNYVLGCRDGDFILIPARFPHPADKHSERLIVSRVPENACMLLWMGPYRRGFQCWLSKYKAGKRVIDPTENYLFLDSRVIELFRLLIDEIQEKQNSPIVEGLLLAFFSTLQREIEEQRYLHPGPIVKAEVTPPSESDFTTQLENYIQRHSNQPLTLEHVARELYMSRAQLARRVRRETGRSFVEFLTEYRIREAKVLLCESEWTAQTIASFVGFKSPAYFHTLFQRQTGYTPGEFRLKMQKNTRKLKG